MSRESLIIKGGPNSGTIVSLSDRPITLGRQPDNDVMVDETTVSRKHALIMETQSGYVLRDLNSTNGTFVGGQRLGQEKHSLRHGDRIRLAGSTVTFIFR